MCQYGGVPGPPAGAGGILQVHHSGTQRDLSDTQTAPKRHGGTSEAAQNQEQSPRSVRQPVSLRCMKHVLQPNFMCEDDSSSLWSVSVTTP